MKITIHTEREIKDEDYDEFMAVIKEQGVPVDKDELLETGTYSFTTILPHTKATTTYRIIKE